MRVSEWIIIHVFTAKILNLDGLDLLETLRHVRKFI